MKALMVKTLILAVAMIAAGCGNLTEPDGFSFSTQIDVPVKTYIKSNVVTIKGNQFPAAIQVFDNSSSGVNSYSQYSINGGSFSAGSSSDQLTPGNTLQIQQLSASSPNTARKTTIVVGGYTTTFTTVTGSNDSFVVTSGNDTVTISNITAILSAGTGTVTYTVNATTNWTNTVTGNTGSTIPVSVTLQAISGSGAQIFSTTATVDVTYGSQTTSLSTGTFPTTATGSLPSTVTIGGTSYTITSPNYWNSLISYWKVGSATIQQQ